MLTTSQKGALHNNNLIFIDGITRVGKTLLAKILPSLQNAEQIEFPEFMEHVLAGAHLKKISMDFAKAFIISSFNELLYNKLLSRKLNFRSSDITSVVNFKNTKIYEKRLKVPEGDNIITKLKKSKSIFLYMTHDVMVNYHLIQKINLNCKIIEVYRNPFDVIFSWHERGWGTRFEKDPKSQTLCLTYNNRLFPWYAYAFPKKWLKMNSVEKCASNVLYLTNLAIKNHKKFKNDKKIITISYENFVRNTESEISRICKFLKTKKTKYTKKALIKENCPTKISEDEQIEKREFIRSKISKNLYKKIFNLTEKYEKNLYNL